MITVLTMELSVYFHIYIYFLVIHIVYRWEIDGHFFRKWPIDFHPILLGPRGTHIACGSTSASVKERTISLNACPDVPRPGKAGKPWSPTKRRAQTIGKTIGKW
jgi:hypothetical protein